ncbi:unnamed protein product [Arctia plantaginis]|uniref:Uncharacterized protein n=1 Tax=Arctia plantaginis TaxID=874455 RepID=A0A8S0ZT63_ARCPL|nr:unnamed protein product [Arctia plantaginis]
MNCRGNRYSRSHVTLNPDTDRKFWQYSMHEIGIYDYKAVIDFILQKTGVKQLSVAAHSEGTSAFFVLASQRPEYNKKVSVFIALAPITYIQSTGPTLTTILNLSPIIIKKLKIFDVEEFAGFNSFAKTLTDALCSQGMIGYELCFNILGSITGFNPENIEQEFASTILGHFPAGTSLKNLIHYVHGYRHKRFVQYDYKLNNFAVYGSFNPPVYDLKKVTTKIALYAAEGDEIVKIKDVERLRIELPNVVHYQVINDKKFNHIDYMWGRNAHVVLYQSLFELLFKFN